MRRMLGTTVVAALCSIGLAVGAQASSGDKVALCHGTASAKNPYVLIHVSENALNGHFDDSAPGHGKKNHPDYVLPAGQSDCSAVPGDDGDGGDENGGGTDGDF
jgi:hypothetical protein